jgi:DNA-3-methyladenine glycosylase
MNPEGKKLTRSFYVRPTLTVARELLGKTIVFNHPAGIVAGDIVETEAYIGEDDPACHAAVGRTERNDVMYGRGGHAYIYFIYGMYHCFNIVTEKSDFPAAVLIRAVEPVAGEEIMASNSPAGTKIMTNGPGKFCRAFGLTREQNCLSLTGPELYLIDRGNHSPEIQVSKRIGIKKGADKPWRFFDAGSKYVSR